MYTHILVAVDNSPSGWTAAQVAVETAAAVGAQITGIHVYAAHLHEQRFTHLEPALPPRYQKPNALERQRSLHSQLIGRGLELIAQSYLAQLEKMCVEREIPFSGKAVEGRNYVEILHEVGEGDYQLVVLGAKGLGAPEQQSMGSVCERVLRYAPVDVLVVRNTWQSGSRPIAVGVDGSPPSFQAVEKALALGRALHLPVEGVAAYDPRLHRAAFQALKEVLSDEAGRLFHFRQQEALHEEVIDKGLEKLYTSHLEQASQIAHTQGQSLTPVLLADRPVDALLRYAHQREPALMVLGRFGLHRTPYTTIGSVAEGVARSAPANVLITADGLPSLPNPQEHREERPLAWTPEAHARLQQVPEGPMRNLTRQRVETLAKKRGLAQVTLDLVEEKYQQWTEGSAKASSALPWTPAAQERVRRVPPFIRGVVIQAVEAYAQSQGAREITPEVVEQAKAHWEATGRFHQP